jgi:hypothetical protein
MTALFLPEVDPHSFFEKAASIAKMPDDETKWPAHVLSNLHQQLPFLSQFEVNIDIQRMEPEAGFAFGHAMLLPKSDPAAATESKNPENMLRIPIIISDRQLQPFHVFEVAGNAFPLTAERVQSALTSPAIFDGPAKRPSGQKSLIDQLHPPYQQRQGFGLHKSAGAPNYENMSADQLQQMAELKRTKKLDKYQRGLSGKERVEGAVRQSTIPIGVGAGLGALRAMGASKAKWDKKGIQQRLGAGLGGALVGTGTGAAITAANQGVQNWRRKKRDAARREMGLLKKEGSVTLSFSSSNMVPASAVVGSQRLPLKSGATVASLAFYQVPGTKFVMAVPRSMAKKLEKVSDQQKLRSMLSGGMREEIRAARSGLPSPGLFMVFEKAKKGYRYLKPSPIAGMR